MIGRGAGRQRKIDDIRSLLRNNADTLDMSRVRHYFSIFDRESLLDELLSQPGAQAR